MIALAVEAVSWTPRHPKSVIFSGWPSAQPASSEPPACLVLVPEDASAPSSPNPSKGRSTIPRSPLTFPDALVFCRFHAVAVEAIPSNVISESGDGLIVPCTRQKGVFIATGVGGSLPTTLDGNRKQLVAAVVVASPKVCRPPRLYRNPC